MIADQVIISAATSLAGVAVGWFISERQRITAFRTAALDIRLKTHQKAFSLWHEMFRALHDPVKRPETAARCQQWWIDNCFYLDARSRKEFIQCVGEAFLYQDLKDPKNPAETAARFKRIQNVFKLLEEGVHLPSIGGIENSSLETRKEPL